MPRPTVTRLGRMAPFEPAFGIVRSRRSVCQANLHDLFEVSHFRLDVGRDVHVGRQVERDPARPERAAQQPRTGERLVQSQQPLADARAVRVRHREACVADDGALRLCFSSSTLCARPSAAARTHQNTSMPARDMPRRKGIQGFTQSDARAEIVRQLAGVLTLPADTSKMLRSGDALDAVVCLLAAKGLPQRLSDGTRGLRPGEKGGLDLGRSSEGTYFGRHSSAGTLWCEGLAVSHTLPRPGRREGP